MTNQSVMTNAAHAARARKVLNMYAIHFNGIHAYNDDEVAADLGADLMHLLGDYFSVAYFAARVNYGQRWSMSLTSRTKGWTHDHIPPVPFRSPVLRILHLSVDRRNR